MKAFLAIIAAASALAAPGTAIAQSSAKARGAVISQDIADCFVEGTCDLSVASKAETGDACLRTGNCAVGKEKLVVLVKPRMAAARMGRPQASANLTRPAARVPAAAAAPRAKVLPRSCTSTAPDALNMCLGFALGSAELSSSALSQVQVFANALKKNPQSGSFRIEGHTDSSGTSDQNQALSRRRAESVVTYLVSQGVPAARLAAQGYGFSHPKQGLSASNPLNRRVEIVRN